MNTWDEIADEFDATAEKLFDLIGKIDALSTADGVQGEQVRIIMGTVRNSAEALNKDSHELRMIGEAV